MPTQEQYNISTQTLRDIDCKVAVLDSTGKFLEKATVYPTVPKQDIEGTKKILKELIYK